MFKIAVENLQKEYLWGEEKIQVLKGVSLEIPKNHFVSIVGESGSGKTTLLNLIGGLDKPDTGRILVDNREITSFSSREISAFRNAKLGFIFQFYNLLQDFTVLENVMLPHYIQSKDKKRSELLAKALLERLGLGHRLTYYPSRLSGGEQQRVAIGRALINSPDIILADEPTGNLDEKNREMVIRLLMDLKKEYGFTFLMVTHDMSIARLADECIRLNYGVVVSREKR